MTLGPSGTDHPRISLLTSTFEDLLARGLKALFAEEPRIDLVACDVPSGALAPALALHRPDVAVINYGILQGVAQVSALCSEFPATRLLVFANHPSPAESRQMLAFGATACLSKSTQERDVLTAVHLASRGLRVLPATTLPEGAPAAPELLTPREVDVLDLLQAGRSNAEIADQLHLSVETVRTHARRVYRKLGVRTRRELRPRR